MGTVAIYTAIFGGYDTLKEQPEIPGVDYHCFTDDPTLRSEQWSVHHVRARYGHPRMSAKYYKTLPHKVLPGYRQTIWIDGGITLTHGRRFVRMAARRVDGRGIALFRHPDRDNIADEARFSMTMPKYRDLPLLEQVLHYRSRGFPDKTGVYAGTILARDSADRRVCRLGKLWLRENERWTYQDQLSLPYLLWRLRIQPGVFPHNLWDNPFLTFGAHASEY